MTTPGHKTSVHTYKADLGDAAPGSVDYNEVDGISSISFGPTRDQLETTDFMTATGARERMSGLKDGVISVSGDFEGVDTGQQNIRDVFAGDEDEVCWVQILWDGTSGFHVPCKVDSFTIDSEVSDKVTFSAELSFTGNFATNP